MSNLQQVREGLTKAWDNEDARGHHFVMARAYGQFERAIKLPAAIDDKGAKARYRRGVLTGSLPKSRTSRGRRIAVELH